MKKYFGQVKAVDGISLSIKKGLCFGLLGPNGAGKTTTLEMIEGLNDIDHGYAEVCGINVANNPYEVKEIIERLMNAREIQEVEVKVGGKGRPTKRLVAVDPNFFEE